MGNEMVMDRDFGAWYRAVSLDTDHSRLSKRWAGVVRAVKGAKVDDALELARTFSGVSTGHEWQEKFRGHFLDEDGTFDPGNHSEVALLAGACLCQLTMATPAAAELAALGVHTAAFGGNADRTKLGAIRRRLGDFLEDRAKASRQFHPLPNSKDRAKTLQSPIQTADQVTPQLLEAVRTALLDVHAEVDELRRRLYVAELARAESSNVLWWLFSAYSPSGAKPFADVQPASAPLLFAFDLADLTGLRPGLPNARAFLREALLHKRPSMPPETSVLSSINDTDRIVRQRLVTNIEIGRLQGLAPVLHAMKQSLSVPNDEVWGQLAATEEYEAIRRPCTSLDLADQIYCELVLASVARSA